MPVKEKGWQWSLCPLLHYKPLQHPKPRQELVATTGTQIKSLVIYLLHCICGHLIHLHVHLHPVAVTPLHFGVMLGLQVALWWILALQPFHLIFTSVYAKVAAKSTELVRSNSWSTIQLTYNSIRETSISWLVRGVNCTFILLECSLPCCCLLYFTSWANILPKRSDRYLPPIRMRIQRFSLLSAWTNGVVEHNETQCLLNFLVIYSVVIFVSILSSFTLMTQDKLL